MAYSDFETLLEGYVYRLGDKLYEAVHRTWEAPDGPDERWFLLELSERGEYLAQHAGGITARFVEGPRGLWWDAPMGRLTELCLEFVAEDREALNTDVDDAFRAIMDDMDW